VSEDLKYDYPFDPEAPNNTAASVYQFVRSGGGRSLLDVGSGPAIVSRVLAQVDGYDVHCLDNDESALAAAAEHGMGTSVVDLEADPWSQDLRGRAFDVVVLADVLEHMRDPGAVLRSLVDDGVVAEDGRLVVSVPNAAHESVLAELLVGDFAYSETGILDSTHVRWFTLTSLSRLLEENGFLVTRVARTRRTLEHTPNGHRVTQLGEGVRELLARLGPDATTYQYVLECHRSSQSGHVAALRAQLDDVARERLEDRAQMHLLRKAAAEHERADASHARELDALRELVREERRRAAAEIERGAQELARLNAGGADGDVAKRLRAIEKSRSYKMARQVARVGRRVAGPALAARRRLRAK
jgi:2-polyprenyl-3-methyl-5-hydroxy-6-metoxy-1,4-benzoquinol methylase